MDPMEVTLKTLVITFDDTATDEDVEDVMKYLLDYKGQALFTAEPGNVTEEIPDEVGDRE
jgi:hypothetical protein